MLFPFFPSGCLFAESRIATHEQKANRDEIADIYMYGLRKSLWFGWRWKSNPEGGGGFQHSTLMQRIFNLNSFTFSFFFCGVPASASVNLWCPGKGLKSVPCSRFQFGSGNSRRPICKIRMCFHHFLTTCNCVYMCVCVYVCVCWSVWVCMGVCVVVCVCVSLCVHVGSCVCACMCVVCMCTCMHVCVSIAMCVCGVCVCVCVCESAREACIYKAWEVPMKKKTIFSDVLGFLLFFCQ